MHTDACAVPIHYHCSNLHDAIGLPKVTATGEKSPFLSFDRSSTLYKVEGSRFVGTKKFKVPSRVYLIVSPVKVRQ